MFQQPTITYYRNSALPEHLHCKLRQVSSQFRVQGRHTQPHLLMPWCLFHYHPFHCPFPLWRNLNLSQRRVIRQLSDLSMNNFREFSCFFAHVIWYAYNYASYFAIRILLDVHKSTVNRPVVECKRYVYSRQLLIVLHGSCSRSGILARKIN